MLIPWLFLILVTGVLTVFMLAAKIANNGNPWPLVILAIAWSMGYLLWNKYLAVNHFRKTIQRGRQRQKERDEP